MRVEVRACLAWDRRARGGHVLHASHSVHEDVKVTNHRAMVDAYREVFGLAPLP